MFQIASLEARSCSYGLGWFGRSGRSGNSGVAIGCKPEWGHKTECRFALACIQPVGGRGKRMWQVSVRCTLVVRRTVKVRMYVIICTY